MDSKEDNVLEEEDKKDVTIYFIVNELQDYAFIYRVKGSFESTK